MRRIIVSISMVLIALMACAVGDPFSGEIEQKVLMNAFRIIRAYFPTSTIYVRDNIAVMPDWYSEFISCSVEEFAEMNKQHFIHNNELRKEVGDYIRSSVVEKLFRSQYVSYENSEYYMELGVPSDGILRCELVPYWKGYVVEYFYFLFQYNEAGVIYQFNIEFYSLP